MGQKLVLPSLSLLISRIFDIELPSIVDDAGLVFRHLLPLAIRNSQPDQLTECLWSALRSISQQYEAKRATPGTSTLLMKTLDTFTATFPQARIDKKKVRS